MPYITLVETYLEVCSQNVDGLISLEGVPDDMCCSLFQRVLQLGKLKPKAYPRGGRRCRWGVELTS
jgi:hypothetical protein